MIKTFFELKGETLTVRPLGKLDAVTSPELNVELKKHLDGVRYITMDFSEVEYITSSGLRVLLAADQLMKERRGRLKVINVSVRVLEIFKLVNFHEIIHLE